MSDKSDKKFKPMRRKIQIVGGNTVTISLPRTWAKKNRLGKGEDDEKEVVIRHQPDGSLLVSPANLNVTRQERNSRHVIRPNPNIDTLKRMIISDYIGGMDNIRLVFKESLSSGKVRKINQFVAKRLIGFDTISYDKEIEIINMTQAPIFDVGKLMEIIRVQSVKMIQRCVAWIEDSAINFDELNDDIQDTEVNIDRQTTQMMRTLQLSIIDFSMIEKVKLPPGEVLHWFSVTKAAESAADLAVAITESARIVNTELHNDLRQQLNSLATTTYDLFSRAMKAFIRHDTEEAFQVLVTQKATSESLQQRWPIAAVDLLETNAALVMRHLEKIISYARKIAEAALNCDSAKMAILQD